MSDPSSTYTLASQELTSAKSTLEELQERVIIKVNLTRNSLSSQFQTFIEELASVSEQLQPLYLNHSEDGPPTIEIQPNLRYMALPNDREMVPFLQSLLFRSKREISLTPRSVSALETFITPTRFEVLMSPACPHCPTVVGLVNQLALASTYVEATIIDITLFPDYGQKYGIKAVPTVVIDEQDKLVGTISEELLVDRLANSDPSLFHPDSFRKIVKEGDAERLAGMMVADGDLYSGSLELLADPDWSVRMGMMVVLEGVAERSPDLVQRAYPYILDLLEHEDDNQRGDTAYLLGLIGDASVMDRLEVLLNDANPQVAEVAFEAVQRIRERENLGK
ncbi:MAG: thioredoxin family protein [Deltaproteobacteria bacterium]|nr:thioredoxin family protein [Deltaproteobacteria bacterium]